MNLPPITSARRKGQPIVVLGGLLACWTGVRVLAWTFSAAAPAGAVPEAVALAGAAAAPGGVQTRLLSDAHPAAARVPVRRSAELVQPSVASAQAPVAYPAQSVPYVLEPSPKFPVTSMASQSSAAPSPPPPLAPTSKHYTPALAGGHQMMFLAALSMMPMPPEFMPPESKQRSAAASRPKAAPAPRWSADGWVLLRRDAGFSSLASSGGSYGASQIGAVLRYRLDRTSANKPSLYLRTSAALNGARQQEAALGLSLRPLGRLPVLAMAEGRVSRSAVGTQLRPAAFFVSELPSAKLPLGLRGEAYVQAGYVGGKGASAFVDGQARIDGKLFSIGKAEMRAGGAAWGGAQTGASRFDIGPSASLSFRLENTASARLSADWRFRVAGRAAPASGPALTLSAGF